MQRVQTGFAVLGGQVQERPEGDGAEAGGDRGLGLLVDPVALAVVTDLGGRRWLVVGLQAIELLLQQGAGRLVENLLQLFSAFSKS